MITSRVPAFRDDLTSVYLGDAGEVFRDLPAASVDCVVPVVVIGERRAVGPYG